MTERKGIIYYLHGYGDYCGRYGYLGKRFAEAGFDFVGMDQKGFGNSGGQRAIIESAQDSIDDQLSYIHKVDKAFGGADTPKFLLGVSMGGNMSLRCSIEDPKLIKGMGLVSPYLRLLQEEKAQKYMPLVKFLDKFIPNYRLSPPASETKTLG